MFYNARWYDSTTGRFAQADTIVPGGVQGLDRYAYVNNSPVNYVDPSGHKSTGCRSGLSDYQCRVHMINIDKLEYKRIQELVQDALDNSDDPQKAQAAIEAIAKYYGIKIAPGDEWLYMKTVGDGVYGWTPRGFGTEIGFEDEFGRSIDAREYDGTVIITGLTLTECGTDLSCIGTVMAHEAVHSWIEYQVENSDNSKFDTAYYDAEEMVASQVALRTGDAGALATTEVQYFYDNKRDCEKAFGEAACSNPRSLVAGAYGINLEDIYSQVYTVFWWRVQQ
jgi:hypothetical protein